MKKIIVVALCLAMILSISACGSPVEKDSKENKSTNEHQHTTDFGACSICGEFQGKERLSEINDKLIAAGKKYQSVYDSFSSKWASTYCNASVKDAYAFLAKQRESLKVVMDDFQAVSDLCGDCKEFSELKKVLSKYAESLPELSSNISEQSIQSFLDDLGIWGLQSYDISPALNSAMDALSVYDQQ